MNDQPTQLLHKLFDDYWESYLKEYPTYATFAGDARYNDKLEDLSPQAIMRRRLQNETFLSQLEAIDAADLSESDRVSYSVLHFVLRNRHLCARLLGDIPQEFGSLSGSSPTPISQMHGPQFWLPQVVASTQFTKVRDYDDYLKRLAAIPAYLEQLTHQLEAGMESSWTLPRVTLRNIPAQFESLASLDFECNPLFASFKSFPSEISKSDQIRLRQAGESVIKDGVSPAFARMKLFLETRYIPASRDEIAASTLPGGPKYYAVALEINTTTTLSPETIHGIGLKEVARIEAEMDAIQEKTGFADSRAKFVDYLKSDPQFFFDSPRALLSAYRDVAKQVDPQLPTLFRELPRLPYGIQAMPKEQGDNAEYYMPGALDCSRAGYFYANTNNLRHTARWQMVALLLHETVPGHHLQIARAQELKDLPMFRRDVTTCVFNAYIEGWALYAETLGDLMGVYDDPLDKYGHLSWELLRAARLVVDTGIHARGWSREKAIQYMRDHTLISEEMIVAEVDRYIVWPGQAVSYKIGQLHILALRDKAKAALNDRFDLREFHNILLDSGALPLEVLAGVIDRWIATQKAIK